jgi:hypothetical protein
MWWGVKSKNRFQNVINNSEIYPDYVEWIEKEREDVLSRQDFIKLTAEFNKRVQDGILDGKRFVLPYVIGWVEIQKKRKMRKRNVMAIDWKRYEETGVLTAFDNDHSDGWIYKIIWNFRSRDSFINKYSFIPTRAMKRKLAKIIKERTNDYYQHKV